MYHVFRYFFEVPCSALKYCTVSTVPAKYVCSTRRRDFTTNIVTVYHTVRKHHACIMYACVLRTCMQVCVSACVLQVCVCAHAPNNVD